MSDTTNYIEGRTGLWEVVIGLEVHAQVSSKTKLFDGCSTEFGAEPNTQIGFFGSAMPGMLPILNKVCVDQAIKTGLGINATVNQLSVFDRKNYFYADLPCGYQISQFTKPIVSGGYLDVDLDNGETKRIGVTRLHLEMDAGKSTHDLHPSKTYIDLNRCGIALMEIVSNPEMRTTMEAMAYVKKLRTILRYLGTCDGNMEQGSMRVDANISLRRPGAPLGTRAEIKNVNSIRFLGQALDYEIGRQMEILEDGGEIVQETRLFDAGKGITRSMRSKEDAHDYRYFPDPDLPPLRLTSARIEAVKATLPELPDAKQKRLMDEFDLPKYDASVLVGEQEIAHFYEAAVAASKATNKAQAAKQIANWLMGEVFAALNRDGGSITTMTLTAAHLAELVDLILDDTISGKIAKDVFLKLWETGKAPSQLVDELGLKQITDTGAIEQVIDTILAQNEDKVADYRSGKHQLFGFFVGLAMKATQGKANPGIVNDILKKKLG
ncbi:Asp-tRNA(Asn)/Glu-tRNA(Gln) amidotransferase subunit GatB [Candidatus Paracaedibacter symbiosus]|uniref:Asp-tRNA(Asn)/Glu-tRNA(Gln) amidotransferase subunit GatB n=1 Tax=Candidatus Paracaedibacter symbiosus TaxID=244582 RepID=UPI0005094FC8|nr:Asp-tRNA(Asn)/Glu-tRNA(Gln) amidotransferase subunit GatB [Candidatus Paracaedibacter symbiosus]